MYLKISNDQKNDKREIPNFVIATMMAEGLALFGYQYLYVQYTFM